MTHAHEVRLELGEASLDGTLTLPEGAEGVVLFAHGSGSSRFSERNRFVARHLVESGLATLLIDLLTAEEDAIDRLRGNLRFDIPLLASRVAGAAEWLAAHRDTARLRIGVFGASTGGGAALVAAASTPEIASVVSRGGRPDLAGESLRLVAVPTLLIVGGEDHEVIQLNRWAFERLTCEKRLEIVAGATHLFEEPGTLAQVAALASVWFVTHLVAVRAH